jgi:hypothetical protein
MPGKIFHKNSGAIVQCRKKDRLIEILSFSIKMVVGVGMQEIKGLHLFLYKS